MAYCSKQLNFFFENVRFFQKLLASGSKYVIIYWIPLNSNSERMVLYMSKLMLGNQAVARGLYEAGVDVVSSYPGTPSTEIT